MHWGLTAAEAQRIHLLDLADGGNIAVVVNACCFDPVCADLDSPGFQKAIATTTPVIDSFQFDATGKRGSVTAVAPPAARLL